MEKAMERESSRGKDEVEGRKEYNEWEVIRRGWSGERKWIEEAMGRESWRGEDEVEGEKRHNEWVVIKRGSSGEGKSGWKS